MSEVPQPPNADHLNAIQEAAKLKEKERAEKQQPPTGIIKPGGFKKIIEDNENAQFLNKVSYNLQF